LIENIPDYTYTDYSYAAGFVVYKGVEAAAVTKGAGTIGRLAGNIRIPVYRVFGGGSRINGFSSTFINPRYFSTGAYRKIAGLPNVNWGTHVIKGTVRIRDIITVRRAP
jgi:hypothetical protein